MGKYDFILVNRALVETNSSLLSSLSKRLSLLVQVSVLDFVPGH